MKEMKCIKCGSNKIERLTDYNHCLKCGAWFDDDPDEGGEYSDRNPAARLEREDRRRERFNQRRK